MKGARGVLDGADEQVVEEVPVGERRLVQRLSAAPAADQVDEPVDPPEALDQRRAPAVHGVLVEQVDGAAVPALGGDAEARTDRVEQPLVAIRPGDGGASRREPSGNQRPKPTTYPGDCNHPTVEAIHMGEAGFEPA